MKNVFIIIQIMSLTLKSFSQITVTKIDGGSVITKLGFNININDGSTLIRDWIMLNDANCPVKLENVGINTSYTDRSYSFKPVGEILVTESIVAYEIHHVLYDVFGNHMKTLSNQEVADISDKKGFDKYSSWYANENNVSEYFIAVSYIANVRTKAGKVWRYKPVSVKEELQKLQITYEDSYVPPKKDEK